MRRTGHTVFSILAALIAVPALAAPPAPLVKGLVNPESVAIGPNGAIYVTAIGEFDKDGDGGIYRIEGDKLVPFVKGLNDPKGIAFFQNSFFVTDKNRVIKIDLKGKVDLIAPPNVFPTPPLFLNDICIDPESGTIYVSDSGDMKGGGGAVYRLSKAGAEIIADTGTIPGLHTPNGVAMEGASHLLLGDFGTGKLHRIKISNRAAETIAEGLGAVDGITFDHFGRLFISDYKGGKLFAIPRPGAKPVLLAEGFKAAADTCLSADGRSIIVPDMNAGTVTAVPTNVIPGAEVDDTPLKVRTTPAFNSIQWTGWKSETDDGKPNVLRPIMLTHGNDGSNRLYMATEHGVIHTFPNAADVAKSQVFLDITDRVVYSDKTNEEGFLGLAFHPNYKENGEFFVFYTPKGGQAKENIVSRFRRSKSDPTKADPASEEIVLKYENRPFWNHDGGTICFGPDGYLYIAHGDGGAGNDPFDNAQNRGNWFGKILRIDINSKDPGKNYAIPKDNPFVGQTNVKPEIWSYGLRNVWRMSFDSKTGQLWAADVGQNLFEEINLVSKGGNFGWNRREGLHPFGSRGTGPKKGLIDPIWEYSHDIGKSITGGTVYRGKAIPEIEGWYIYGDYVSAKLWALKYDFASHRVVANRPLITPNVPILSFGDDEQGELYLLTTTPTGKNGLLKLTK